MKKNKPQFKITSTSCSVTEKPLQLRKADSNNTLIEKGRASIKKNKKLNFKSFGQKMNEIFTNSRILKSGNAVVFIGLIVNVDIT